MTIAKVTITTTGDKTSTDIPFLAYKGKKIGLVFSGSTLPTTLEVGFLQQDLTFVPFTGGAITSLPTSFPVNHVPPQGLALNVAGGSPNFDVDFGGDAGPLTQ